MNDANNKPEPTRHSSRLGRVVFLLITAGCFIFLYVRLNEGKMAAFGFVQHNFFVLFNALIGVAFWRRAQRELFGP